MIAIDTSSFIAYLSGEDGRDVDLVDRALLDKQVVLPPAVLSELMSDPELPLQVEKTLKGLPLLELTEGYWHRVGKLRAALLSKGTRPKLADSLIAQSCIDHDVSLITRDKDFGCFARLGKLKIFL